jgi:hypothetical protein
MLINGGGKCMMGIAKWYSGIFSEWEKIVDVGESGRVDPNDVSILLTFFPHKSCLLFAFEIVEKSDTFNCREHTNIALFTPIDDLQNIY